MNKLKPLLDRSTKIRFVLPRKSIKPSEQWNDMPAVSEDYNNARDAIVARVRHLLDQLRSAK